MKDLASRDVISRAMYLEMQDGRGINGKRYLYLDVRPETVNKYAALDGRKRPDGTPYVVTAEEILTKLPDIVDFCRTYLGVDPVSQPMPVQPTAHYAMGGIPTNKYGEVVIDEQEHRHARPVCAGEVACVSVHGANRLGTNSLLDLMVFGKYSGLKAAEYAKAPASKRCPPMPRISPRQQFDASAEQQGHREAAQIGKEMKAVMIDHVGVFRTEEGMQQALDKVHELRSASNMCRSADQRQDLQHRPAQHLGAGQPARAGRGDHGFSPGAQGKPRRARPRGLPQAR